MRRLEETTIAVPSVLAASFLALAVTFGCTSPPEPTTYLMRSEAPPARGATTRPDDAPRVGLGRIVVAPYLLASQGLVIETAPGEVRPAQLHQWAEPVDDSLRWFLQGELERRLGHPVSTGVDARNLDYRITIFVSQLHGMLSGDARLEASFAIRSGSRSEPLVEKRFSSSRSLAQDDYAALAEAEQQLIAELAAAIAQAIREQTN